MTWCDILQTKHFSVNHMNVKHKTKKNSVVGGLVVNDKDPNYSWITIYMWESAQVINLFHYPISLVQSV